MPEPIVDHVPGPAGPSRPSRHGRSRGGAPKGNLNALKHGRYSRFKDALLPEHPVAAGAARRLLSRERRIAERHAANLLALARLARYRADRAAAVEAGIPLPPPPLITERDVDLPALQRLLGALGGHATLERRRAAGLLTAQHDAVAKGRAWARSILTVLPHALAALDRSVVAALSPADLSALLHPTLPGNPENNGNSTPTAESAPAKQPPHPDSQPTVKKNSKTTPVPSHEHTDHTHTSE